MAGLSVVQDLKPVGRVSRRPAHTFALKSRAYAIQPFMVAPVLPGETLKNLLLQARIVSSPVANPLIGWWKEYYFFYVKLRDLAGRDDFTQMILTPGFDLSGYDQAAEAITYHAGPGINWTRLCLERCVEEYFRDEGEAVDAFEVDGLPAAAVNNSSWLDSARLNADADPDHDENLLGVEPTLPAYMTGWENHYAQWEHMRALKLTAATFEDWLKSFGVSAPKPDRELHRPELLRYVRDWAYPTQTADGDQLLWSVAERADKDRFFAEPGFVLGLTVSRPKVYFSKQEGAAAGMMNDAFSFLPAVMASEAYTSLRKFETSTSANGPLGSNPSGAYWVDLRDLLIYGDQFANFDLSDTGSGAVALPKASLAKRFCTTADINGLWLDYTAGDQFREDGIVTMNILGTQRDQT